MLVLTTLGAPERRLLGGRRPRDLERAEPAPVPTSRATVVRPDAFASERDAEDWLEAHRREPGPELDAARRVLNRALRAQRAAAADPYVADVSPERALAVRIGYGPGDAVADGRFREALELPVSGPREARRSIEAPEERFAALLGGREQPLPAEEHVLRARADLDAGRVREAALEARVALESLLADTDDSDLGHLRGAVRAAASAALEGGEPTGIEEAVSGMESVLRRRRLGAGS
ncbi:MAG TPA: hypothetical protein VK307_10625 [Thermoleophilaceae bacterium]|nr:hypothetical protein [Thermoleophilaceae bacterium]